MTDRATPVAGPAVLDPPRSQPLYLRHALAGADHALDQRRRADADVHDRAADLQRASCAVLGNVVVHGAAPMARDRRTRGPQGSPIGYTRAARTRVRRRPACSAIRRSTTDSLIAQGFPAWLTVPSHQWLSMARAWHFFFAWVFVINGLCYVAYSIVARHLARDLLPTRADIRGIGASIVDHLRFRHPTGEAAKRYNVLQKFAYLIGDLRAAAADHPDGLRHVAAARHAVRRLGGRGLADASRRARSISSSRGCSSRSC